MVPEGFGVSVHRPSTVYISLWRIMLITVSFEAIVCLLCVHAEPCTFSLLQVRINPQKEARSEISKRILFGLSPEVHLDCLEGKEQRLLSQTPSFVNRRPVHAATQSKHNARCRFISISAHLHMHRVNHCCHFNEEAKLPHRQIQLKDHFDGSLHDQL